LLQRADQLFCQLKDLAFNPGNFCGHDECSVPNRVDGDYNPPEMASNPTACLFKIS